MQAAVKITAIGLAALATAGLGALPYYSSKTLDQRLNEMASQSSPQSDVLLRNLQHHAGFLSSKGSVDVVMRDRCHDAEDSADTTFHIEYEAQHLPTPGASNRFDWKLKPTGEAAPAFAKLFGSDAPLSGHGQITWGGLIRSDMKLPAMAYATGGQRIEADPSQGTIALGGNALQFDWKLERAVFRGPDRALELKQLGVNLDLSNRHRGIGAMALKLGSLSTAEASVDGYELKSVTTEHGDKIDSVFTQGVARAQFSDQEIKDMVLEASLKGLHAQSVETLTKVLGSSCGMESLTRDESTQVRKAVQTLLASGLSGGITKLSGQGKQGGLNGKLTVELAAVGAGQAISFARQLSATGELAIQGDLLPPGPRQMAMSTGFAQETADGIQSGFVFEKGLLKVNGKTLDGAGIQNALAAFDTTVMAYINNELPKEQVVATAPATAPQEEAPAEVAAAPAQAPEAEAPAPAPAPMPSNRQAIAPAQAPEALSAPATCTDARTCVNLSLRAAWKEDLDSLRDVATQLDALPKPALGNKAQARKLNNQALEMLKAGDTAAAAALLQAALKENPRDVEIASNLGYALLKDQRPKEAAAVLNEALVLDPRRTATWAPLGEALGQLGQAKEASAALWTAWQWSGNRDRTLTAYVDKANREAGPHPALAEVFRVSANWVGKGEHPSFR